ncbi:hypothetical protein GALL_491710 [mine drainage metagenome]|uniref:Uncharacterized protein n=1 Tax=mine drainage metagenome TaxID=410659 RepID=A0A1J5PN94_9ZZZZ
MAAEKIGPDALAAGGRLIGQQADCFARAQRAQQLPHSGQIGWSSGKVVTPTRRQRQRLQRGFARRAVHHGDRPPQRGDLRRHFETAQVRSQVEYAAALCSRRLDMLASTDLHAVHRRFRAAAEPHGGHFAHHAPGLDGRTAGERAGRVSGLLQIGAQPLSVNA